MKRITSIFLVILLLFNALGFYGLLVGLQYQKQQRLLLSFDNGSYDQELTTLIKIPLAVPYATEQHEYQRVNGGFEHQGEYYKLIKQKLSQDTLYVICMKDQDSKKINRALKDYAKTLTDKPVNGKHSSKVAVHFLKDYYVTAFSLGSLTEGWKRLVLMPSGNTHLFSSYHCSIAHPPNRI